MGFPSHPSFSSKEQGGQGGGRSHKASCAAATGALCGSALGTPTDFHISSSSTPGTSGAPGSGAQRFPFSRPSLSVFQQTCPQKPAHSSPNISRSRASARGRHRRNSFQIAHFCKDFLPFFWPCLPHLMLLSLDYFFSCFLSFSPCSLGFLPLALFLPLLSLLHTVWPTAFSTCSFPGVSRDDMDCVLVLSSAFIREGEEKEGKKASNPWKLARRQYSGRVTLLLLSLHAALQFAWRRDYLGCSKGTSLPGSQQFGRADLASLLLP